MYTPIRTRQFKRDTKLCIKQGKDIDKFFAIHDLLIEGKELPVKNKDHALTNNWRGCRDCHIEPDWVLIYRIDEKQKEIEYIRMGSHSEIFG